MKQPPDEEEIWWRRLDALPRDTPPEQFRWEHDKILCDLLESDVPISPGTRRQAARDLRAYYAGIPLKQWRKRQSQVGFTHLMMTYKRNLQRRDKISVTHAEEIVAKRFGMSVYAMRQRIQRLPGKLILRAKRNVTTPRKRPIRAKRKGRSQRCNARSSASRTSSI